MVNEQRWLTVIFALYAILGVGYSLLMPIWEAPDEPAHYHLAWHLATYQEFPSDELNYEAHQPRAFYVAGSWVLRALNTLDPELTRFRRPREYPANIRKAERRFEWTDENYRFIWGVYLLRWLNLGLGGLAAWLNWKTFKRIAPARPGLCLSALAISALTPQYLHIMSSVNNDVPATLGGALLFYLAIRVQSRPSAWPGLAAVFSAIVLPLTTKLNVLPVSAALLVILSWQWFSTLAWKRALLYAALSILVAGGIFYALFPDVVLAALDELRWRLFSLRKNALTVKYIRTITGQIVWTFWGKVGWLAVGLPVWLIGLLTGFGIVGMLLSAFTAIRSKASPTRLRPWLGTGLIALLTVLAVFRNGLTTFATQGRLLFPAMGALSLLMVAGWHHVLPERFQQHLHGLTVLVLVAGTLILWLTGVLPVYYQPFLD